MDKKRTAEERRRRAEENGFSDDDTDTDDNPIPGDGLDYTKENVTQIQSLNSLHTSDRSDRWYSVELLRGLFQAITTEEWNYPIVRSI